MKFKKLALVILAITQVGQVYATERIGRYTSVEHGVTAEQKDLLQTRIQFEFPSQVKKIGDALDLILAESGYRLEPYKSSEMSYLLNHNLPLVHRQVGPATLLDVIQTLVGDQWVIKTNPVSRSMRFELKPDYISYLVVEQSSKNQVQTQSPNNDVNVSQHKNQACIDGQSIHARVPIYFAPSSYALNNQDKTKLQIVIDELKRDESLQIIVRGYSDDTGDSRLHTPISIARANAVAEFFNHENLKDRILEVEGLGVNYHNPSVESRFKRVVEVEIVDCVKHDAHQRAGKKEEQKVVESNTVDEKAAMSPLYRYSFKSGDDLELKMAEWAKMSGYELVWNVKDAQDKKARITLTSTADLGHDFYDATEQLINAFNLSGIPLRADIYQRNQKFVVSGVVNQRLGGGLQ